MAEAGNDTGGVGGGGGGAGWWGNFMSVAKTKSAEVFEFMKRDFDEFSSAVKTEATMIANQTASAVKETLQLDNEESAANSVKRSVSSFFGQVKEALSPSPSTDFDEALVIHDGNPVAMTKLQRKIYALMSDDSTYLRPIGEAAGPEAGLDGGEEAKARFRSWHSVATQEESGVLSSVERLTNILATNPTLQDKYTTLVPDSVSHTEFWERYLFRKAVIEDREAELERWLERERKQADSYPWEQGKFKDETLLRGERADSLELTEEEQIRLLEEYEMERNGGSTRAGGGSSASVDHRVSPPDSVVEGPPSPSNRLREDSMDKDNLTMREKKDMVIVGNGPDMSQTSSSSKASTDGDWEKEFDIDDAESSPSK